ncbi:hypothetical protein B9G55_09025 [Saccharibacillus sp. O16]|nr:hypothetical protein B9G55_09025 [Saccharibacillus sp. O16]
MIKKWLVLAVGLLLILGVPVIGITNILIDQRDLPKAEDGRIDLSGWNDEDRGAAPLEGTWEFYPNVLLTPDDFAHNQGVLPARKLLTVPGAWNSAMSNSSLGAGTYRLIIDFGRKVDEDYALKIDNIRMSSQAYLNGDKVGSSGYPSLDHTLDEQKNLPYIGFSHLSGSQVELVIQVTNYSYVSGGIVGSVTLGPESIILRDKQVDWAGDFSAFFGFFLPGLLFLLLHMLHKRERPALYLGLFCMLGALYMLTHGEKLIGFFLPTMPYWVVLKLQAISASLIYLMLISYMNELMPGSIHRYLMRAYTLLTVSGAITALILPPEVFSILEPVILSAGFLSLVYAAFITIRWIQKQPDDLDLVTIGLMSIMMCMLLSLVDLIFALDVNWLVIDELVLFVLAQTILIIRRFVRAFADVERLSNRLLTLDGLKDEFMANTSHELRTPLHGIINIARSMLEGAAGPVSPKQKENLAMMMTTGQRLSLLVDDILDFSKLKEGRLRLSVRPLALYTVVQSVVEVIAYTLAEKPIRMILDCPEDLPNVKMDEDRLRQILYNLLGNSVKYTERGEIRVRASASDGWVTVEVSDTGIGIERERWPDIFRRFERIEAREGMTGNGLGLSITRELVELGGGRIWLDSEPGVGTSFFFTLPISSEQPGPSESRLLRLVEDAGLLEPESTPPSSPLHPGEEWNPPNGEAGRVLIVDDDPVNRRVLLNLLTTAGYEATAVEGGAEALRMLDEQPGIELVVTDWMMPGMSGLELCRRIRERRSLADLPVLLLTARSLPEDIQAGFDAGASDFLGKPVDAGELRARVRTLIGMRRAAEEAVSAEMAFLQAQIKPHFLYNALNVIIATCPVDPDQATELLIELSHYLRGSFDFQNRDRLVPLGKELELVGSYIALEQARFGERLTFEYEADDLVGIFVPPLCIQPLVENAVRHGVMQRSSGGIVRLSVRDHGSSVSVRVWDNGVGLQPERFHEIMNGREGGVGLRNIHRRLSALHGATLRLEETAEGAGTTIGFDLPKALSI